VDPLRPYLEVDNELSSYSQRIQTKAKIIVLNKVDMVPDAEKLQKITEVYGRLGYPVLLVSALRKDGVTELVRRLTQMLSEVRDNDSGKGPETRWSEETGGE
jgi:GTP-binding protein